MPGSFLAKYMPRRQQESYIMNGGIHHAPGANLNSEYRASSGTVVTTLSMEEADKSSSEDPAQINFLPKSGNNPYSRSCFRQWTSKEKHMLMVCAVLFVICVIVIAVMASHPGARHTSTVSDQVCLTKDCVTTAAHLMSGMDFSAKPCHDFYQYACGTWNRKHLIPDEKASFTTFDKLHEELEIVMRGLLERPSRAKDSLTIRKSKLLYQSCINESYDDNNDASKKLQDVIDDLGGWPILDDSWSPDSFVLEDVLGKLRGKYNEALLFKCYVGTDDKNSSVNIIIFKETEMGMPSREYFLLPEHKVHRDAYQRLLKDLVRLMGRSGPDADRQIEDIIEFETKLTKVTTPSEERADTGALYMKMTVREFQTHIPKIDVIRYLRHFIHVPFTDNEPTVVFALNYIKQADKIIQETDKRTVANYLIWRTLMDLAPDSTKPFREAYSRFNQAIKGNTLEPVQWKKCVKFVNDKMGLAVAAMFIEEHFDKNNMETADEMIHLLRESFNELLEENEWMDERTKKFAKEKALAIDQLIGYPAFINDPAKLDKRHEMLTGFVRHNFFHNVLQLRTFDSAYLMKKLREPIQRDAWEQPVVIANAFYNPNTNAIVFPAGILQPIFYSDKFPKSLNFGGIGVVIGHEITHGFDDKGRQYDKDGNIKQWWDNHTIKAFHRQTQCIIDQYSNFKLEQINEYVNGKITQGEDIADNGGLKQSFRAYRKWVAIHGEEQPLPAIGLNHNQLFFLNYARIWCGNVRPAEALRKIRVSVHSPSSIRLLGALSNSKDFSEAFNCPVGSRMNPAKKCSVW